MFFKILRSRLHGFMAMLTGGRHRPAAPRRLALGIERIGLLSPRFPIVVGLVAAAVATAAALGIGRLKVDDSLSQLFHSDTPEFRQFEAESRRFPSSEFDVLAVIEGRTLCKDRRSKRCATLPPTCSWSMGRAASSRSSRRESRRPSPGAAVPRQPAAR
jgi:hypothetical protein